MLLAKLIKSQAKTVYSCNRVMRLKHTNEGSWNSLACQQTSKNCFEESQRQDYLDTEQLPLPLNVEDLTSSERLKFSPERSRDINGYFMSSSAPSSFMDLQSDNKLPVDARIECYDCSGTVNLSSAMQTNVPFPYVTKVKPVHLNMPGGQWRQEQKYVSEDLNNVHHANTRELNSPSGASVSLGSGHGTKNYYLHFPRRELNSSCRIWFSFSNINSTQFRTFCTVKEKIKSILRNSESKSADPKLFIIGKLQKFIKEYGPIGLGLHIIISLTCLLIVHVIVSSGIDTSSITKTFGGSEGALTAESVSDLVIIFTIYKILSPVRIILTLVLTPFLAKRLRQKGLWKLK